MTVMNILYHEAQLIEEHQNEICSVNFPSDCPERHSTAEIQINYMIFNVSTQKFMKFSSTTEIFDTVFFTVAIFPLFSLGKICATIYEIFSTICFSKSCENEKVTIK